MFKLHIWDTQFDSAERADRNDKPPAVEVPSADTMATDMPLRVQVGFEQEVWVNLSMTPWMSYKIKLPIRPLPPVSARPEIKTERLVVRPIMPTDVEAFHELRQDGDTQAQSTSRGRPDRDLDETRENVAKLQAPHDERHWYWGAFLASTGEMIGEGGIPDSEDQPTSGWTRCEILIKSAYWRQGYGTELFTAVLNSWWDLPRELRRHQLLPIAAGNKDAGQEVHECIELVWEGDNIPAGHFFAKMLGKAPVTLEGFFESFDWREGRDGDLIRWCAALALNPRGITSS